MVESVGINYGQVADNLPEPGKVVKILSSLGISKVRIYDTNPKILTAFANSEIELIITVPDDMVGRLTDSDQAVEWVTANVKPFYPSTRISGIAVGNEVYTTDDDALKTNLVQAMVSIHKALVQLNLNTSSIHVSTANSLAVLQDSYPPSSGSFKPELVNVISPFLRFLAATGAPFWINAYPYFTYKDSHNLVPLDYVLFNPNVGMDDPFTKLHYDNMLYAQVDAVVFALARMGFGGVDVRVAETGWPSKGDSDEFGATAENARDYNKNLVVRQIAGEGTPLRPDRRLEVYLFALFNEDLKPGPTSERNYGLYKPDGTMSYNVGLTASATSAQSITLTSSSQTALTSTASASSASPVTPITYYWITIYFLTYQCLITFQIK